MRYSFVFILILCAISIHAEEPVPFVNLPLSTPLDFPSGEQPYAEVTYLQSSSSLDLRTGRATRNLIIQALVFIPETFDALGIAHQVKLTELTDEQGKDLLNHERNARQIVFVGPRNYSALTRYQRDNVNAPISVNTSLHGLGKIPDRIQTLRGKAYVLAARRRAVREVSPIVSGQLVELAPALVLQIISVSQEGNTLVIEFRYDAEQAGPFFNPNVDPPVVDVVTLIDDRGQEIVGRGGAPHRQDADQGVFQGQGRLSFNLISEGKPVALRFSLVTEVEEREIEFSAHNVRMPVPK